MPNIKFNFEGKVVLITGSASGIGAGTAFLFAESGANVVLTDRNAHKLSEMAKRCEQLSPKQLKPLQVLADVTKKEDLKTLVESTIKEYGKLDILVNNAGYADNRAITDPDYMDVFNSIMQTNLNSVVYLTHICVEHLAKTKGNVINISSISAYIPGTKMSSYSMSKSAVNMFTKCMVAELGPLGIRVNSVNPGWIRTGILEHSGLDKGQSDSIFDSYSKKYPIGRVGETQDIANAVLYLASEEASFCTGSNLLADGGHMAANIGVDLSPTDSTTPQLRNARH